MYVFKKHLFSKVCHLRPSTYYKNEELGIDAKFKVVLQVKFWNAHDKQSVQILIVKIKYNESDLTNGWQPMLKGYSMYYSHFTDDVMENKHKARV